MLDEAAETQDLAQEGEGAHKLFADAPDSVSFRKLRKRLLREVRETMSAHAMVRPGARWLVGISGGKDSYTLLSLLVDLQWRGLLPVDILACNLDQGQPGFPKHVLPDFLSSNGIVHRIEYRDTYSVVKAKVPAGEPIAPSARGCDAATSTGSPGRRGARPWFLATTGTTASKPSFSTCSMAANWRPCRPSSSTTMVTCSSCGR